MSESLRMDPADVPDELIAAIKKQPPPPMSEWLNAEAWTRAILAAVLPAHEKQLREQIADSIDAELADPNSDYERGLEVASRIARGES
jgi:hypothetical protein